MKTSRILQNNHICLRTLSILDASENYLSWMIDPDINRFLEARFAPPTGLDDLKAFIAACVGNPNVLLMGIFLIDGHKHIGNIKLGPVNRHHRVADVGFLIGDKSQWGKNFASQAIALISDFGLSELGLDKVTAGAYEENVGSQKALLKAGFVQEGELRSQVLVNGFRQNVKVFGKTRTIHA
jgi:RimJ/RimL family protein N-acetyltransferase